MNDKIDLDPIEPAFPHKKRSIRNPLVWLAIGFGLGLMPKAPGTWGTLLGPPLVWGLTLMGLTGLWLIPAIIILFVLGIPICAAGGAYFELKDPPGVVYDEYAAFAVLYILTPFNWQTAIAGFLLFRIFDIIKPWPIRKFELLPGGLGIMVDDFIAAIYAMLVLWLSMMAFGLH